MVGWRVGLPGAPPLGTLDPDILTWCEAKGFILVTNNRRSLAVHLTDHLAQSRHVPGIFVMNSKMSIGDTLEELPMIWGAETRPSTQTSSPTARDPLISA